MAIRNPNKHEIEMLRKLIEKTGWKGSDGDWERSLQVESMDDGGMGSFRILSKGGLEGERVFGKEVASYSILDTDGVEVLVSLNLDQNGELYEVDVWKVDYSPVFRFQDA